MGTFHSVFARILRSRADKLGYPSNFTIYDSWDSLKNFRYYKEIQLDRDIYKPKQILSRTSSFFKNSLVRLKRTLIPDLQETDMAKKPKWEKYIKL
jgi:DNA helicase-2/ATP-dependent DNA helicase PcrA